MTSSQTALYRLFADDGRLLYIGITNNTHVRWRQHSKDKEWWLEVASKTVTSFPDRLRAARAEASAIRTERPAYNVSYSLDGHHRTDLTSMQEAASIIRSAIEDGEYEPGAKLPGNSQLAFELKCTVETARLALQLLAREGYVSPIHRLGTFVRRRHVREVVSIPDRFSQSPVLGLDATTSGWVILGEIEEGWAREDHELARFFGEPAVTWRYAIAPNDTGPALQLITCAIRESLAKRVPELAEVGLLGDRYNLIEQATQGRLQFEEHWTGERAAPDTQRRLDLAMMSHVMVRRRQATANGLPVELTEATMSAERFALAYKVQRDSSASWPR